LDYLFISGTAQRGCIPAAPAAPVSTTELPAGFAIQLIETHHPSILYLHLIFAILQFEISSLMN
jgi:hypothetical protein